jgi:hypothetical protein
MQAVCFGRICDRSLRSHSGHQGTHWPVYEVWGRVSRIEVNRLEVSRIGLSRIEVVEVVRGHTGQSMRYEVYEVYEVCHMGHMYGSMG